jgi:hypothetical protein
MTMVSKTKIALIVAIAAIGIASPALADDFLPIPQYSLPSEAPNYGAAPSEQGRQTVVHGRALYDSAAAPTSNGTDNWANDAEWSSTSRVVR